MRALEEFTRAREWNQFHTFKILSKIAIEAGELLECFQWPDQAEQDRAKEELAEVVTYCRLLALVSGVVLAVAVTFGTVAVTALPAETKAKAFKNCAELNKKYAHGAGRPGAKDKVRGKTKPVTIFNKDMALYDATKKSDLDNAGIACERR